MKALVVYCNPNPDSFTAHLRDRIVAALEANGASVRLTDLYGERFDPVMSREERALAYAENCVKWRSTRRLASKQAVETVQEKLAAEIARVNEQCETLRAKLQAAVADEPVVAAPVPAPSAEEPAEGAEVTEAGDAAEPAEAQAAAQEKGEAE